MTPDAPGFTTGCNRRPLGVGGLLAVCISVVQDGIAVLAYDRRSRGQSTGGKPFNLDARFVLYTGAYSWLCVSRNVRGQRTLS